MQIYAIVKNYTNQIIIVKPSLLSYHKAAYFFYNTLFDENASCHLALGRTYKACMRSGEWTFDV